MATVGTFYQNIRSARTTLRDIGRMREIALVLVRHGFGHVVQTWRFRDQAVVAPVVVQQTTSDRLSGPARLTIALQELGPTFVKLGQILSTRSDLIPQDWCDHLTKLQDRVEPFPVAQAREVIESELEQTIEELFADFQDQPLASASIAQVHVATLLTGEEVVVKVRRPDITTKIESDLHLLYWVARQLEDGLPEARAFDPVAIVGEFEKSITKELNLEYEVAHLQRFQRNFSEWKNVHVPVVYPDYCSPALIVMERLNGVKITDGASLGHDMKPIAHDCVHMIFKMVFEDGFFHGDLHPGNLLVLEDSRIGLIDFGLVGRMTQSMKDGMAELLLALVMQDAERVARAFYALSRKRGPVDYEAYEQDVADLMLYHFQNTNLSDIEFGKYLHEIVEGAIRHNLSVPPNYTMFFKALMTVEGIGKKVSPDLDLIAECKPYVESLVAERYGPERLMREFSRTSVELAGIIHRLPASLSALMRMLDTGKLPVVIENPQLQEERAAAERRINRIIVACSGVGLVIGSSLIHSHQGNTEWTLLPSLMLTLGLGLSLSTVIKILFNRNW